MGVYWVMFLGKVQLVLRHNSGPSLDKEPGSPICINQPLASHGAQHCSRRGARLKAIPLEKGSSELLQASLDLGDGVLSPSAWSPAALLFPALLMSSCVLHPCPLFKARFRALLFQGVSACYSSQRLSPGVHGGGQRCSEHFLTNTPLTTVSVPKSIALLALTARELTGKV